MGSPIAHSLSPVLHTAAYDALGLTGWTYRALECDGAALPVVLRELDEQGLAGVSLTMPLKRAVLPLLARTERLAADVGAANTVLFGGVLGEWWGANTDVPGMVAAIRRVAPSAHPAGSGSGSDAGSVPGAGSGPGAVVLGGGATAASAIAAMGALRIGSVLVVARRPDVAAAALVPLGAAFGVDVSVTGWTDDSRANWTAPLVVSTVPAGAADGLAAGLADRLAAGPAAGMAAAVGDTTGRVLFDVVYSPWPTALAAAWQSGGGQVIGGLELLVEQAAHQVTLMTGREPPLAAMRAAGERALADRPNSG